MASDLQSVYLASLVLEERSTAEAIAPNPTFSQRLSSSMTTFDCDDAYTSKIPSPPKSLADPSPKRVSAIDQLNWPLDQSPTGTTATNPIHAEISRLLDRQVDFCLEESMLDEDGALIVAKNVTLLEFWIIMDNLGSSLPRMELRSGVLVFLQPKEIHNLVAANVGELVKASLSPKYFYHPGTANFDTGPTSTKSPDYSFAPLWRIGPGSPADRNFATLVIEVVDTELATKLINDKETILGGTSRVQLLLSIHLPKPGRAQLYTILFRERNEKSVGGRSFRRSFELTTVESLDIVLPEDAKSFSTWPWFRCRRELLFNGVKVPDRPVGVQFWLNVRKIGNCIKTTTMNLAQQIAWRLTAIHPPESESDSDEELVEMDFPGQRSRSHLLKDPFTSLTYRCVVCTEKICLVGMADSVVPSDENWIDFHCLKGKIGTQCIKQICGNAASVIAENNTILEAGWVFEKANCAICHTDISFGNMKSHRLTHNQVEHKHDTIQLTQEDFSKMKINTNDPGDIKLLRDSQKGLLHDLQRTLSSVSSRCSETSQESPLIDRERPCAS